MIESCGVPDTLVHGDFHPGNVGGPADDHVILDWGDSFVGNPLIDELAFTQPLGPDDAAAAARLVPRRLAADRSGGETPSAPPTCCARCCPCSPPSCTQPSAPPSNPTSGSTTAPTSSRCSSRPWSRQPRPDGPARSRSASAGVAPGALGAVSCPCEAAMPSQRPGSLAGRCRVTSGWPGTRPGSTSSAPWRWSGPTVSGVPVGGQQAAGPADPADPAPQPGGLGVPAGRRAVGGRRARGAPR